MSDELDQVAAASVEASRPTRAIVFPAPAVDEIRMHANRFVDEVVRETERVATRNRADHASPDHVRIAVDNLGTPGRTRRDDLLGALGGATFGAGLSAYAALLLVGTYPPLGVAIATVLLVIGASLLAYELKN